MNEKDQLVFETLSNMADALRKIHIQLGKMWPEPNEDLRQKVSQIDRNIVQLEKLLSEG